MADEKSDDWKNKASEIAKKSKTAASKGLQSAKEGTKTLVSEGKSIAGKGIEKTQKAVKKAVDSTGNFVTTKMDQRKASSKKSKIRQLRLKNRIPFLLKSRLKLAKFNLAFD